MTLAFGRTRRLALLGALAALCLLLAGCAGGASAAGSAAGIIIGAVGPTPALDPAGASDDGSLALQAQLFSRLLTVDPDTGKLEPDIAETAAFTTPTTFTVRLRPHQQFANGDTLTSSDVKFSFDRQRAIKAPSGSAKDLDNLVSISTPNPNTVVFHLKTGLDQTFESVLASSAGAIVDEQVFSAKTLSSNDVIVQANAFGGQYRVDSYHATLITLAPNTNYIGYLGNPKTSSIAVKIYANSANARLDLQDGTIDIAYGLSGDDVARAGIDGDLQVQSAPGAEARFLIFNMNTMPFGAAQGDADAHKALAIRQAIADLIDRDALSKSAHSGTALPLYSVVPLGQADSITSFESEFGDGRGGPDFSRARAILDAAGIPTPVALTLQFTPTEFGAASSDEYTQLRKQLQDAGLFTIKLQFSEYAKFAKDVAANAYPVYQGDHIADIPDPSNSLALFGPSDPLLNNYADDAVNSELERALVEPDTSIRSTLIQDLQLRIAANVPVVPLLQSQQIAVTSSSISGVTFDARSGLRFGELVRSGQ